VIAAARNEAFESGEISHGFLTAAMLEALSSQAASSSPTLNAKQLVTFVKQRVSELSKKKQEVTAIENGIDLDAFEIARGLPALPDVAQSAKQYIETLDLWNQQNFLDFETRNECESVIKAWEKSNKPDGPPLSPLNQRLFMVIQQHLNSKFNADVLGAHLKREIDSIKKEAGQ
jgi:hypothetical protein